jgi:transcriptional regulator with XRE-family HTH domain
MQKGNDNMLMGEKIKHLREQKGLSQYRLAQLIGIAHQQQISFWECGQTSPSLFNCIMLADVFNVSLDELCCRNFKGDKQ